MNLKEKMEEFNKRWNITSDESYGEAFNKFKVRILNIFKDIESHVTDESITAFCQYYGISEDWESSTYGDSRWINVITDRLNKEKEEKEFYRLIELIFSLDINQTWGYHRDLIYSRNILYKQVVEAINLSNINVAITTSDDNVILYPKGEEKLDSELVNPALGFLNKESNGHFIQALKFYQAKKSIKSAESLRRSLEEFLRSKLKNTKGLDSNISELQKTMKVEKSDPQIRNIIFQTLSYLDKYFNENSKHNDGNINDTENEFLIYQTALLMRYINSAIK